MIVAFLVVAMFLMTSIVSPVASAQSLNQTNNKSSTGYQFMPWICQFCGSETNYTSTVVKYHNLFTDLSYEQYYLAGNGTFQSLGVKNLVGMANQYHLKAFPMIISASPSTMHLLFTNTSVQQIFIQTAVSTAVKEGYAGYNIDFEVPYYSDSASVTSFVSNFSNAMVMAGKQLTLDVIGFHGFSPQAYGSAYNYSALSNTSVSRIVVEDYYAMTDFEEAVNYSVQHIPVSKLMIAVPDYGYAFYVNATSTAKFPNNLIYPYVNYSYSGMYGALKAILKKARDSGAQISEHFSKFYGESYYEIIYPNNKNVGNEYYFVGQKAMQLRLHFLESKGIMKAALWRAGATDPAMWSAVYDYKVYIENSGFAQGFSDIPMVAETLRVFQNFI